MIRKLAALAVTTAAAAYLCAPAAAQAPQSGRQAQPQQGQAREGAAPQGQAQPPQIDRAKMEGYLGSQAYVNLLQQAMMEAEKSQPTECKTVAATKRIGLALMAPITFDGAQPSQGAWWDRLEADRCGKKATYNLLVTHRPGEGSRAAPLLMGTTNADPVLQQDARSVVLDTAANAPGKNKCKEHQIETTQFQGPEKPPQGQQRPVAWTELWTVRGCGRQVPIQVRFQPTPQGTAISARVVTPAKKR